MQFPNKACGMSSEYIHPLYLFLFSFYPFLKFILDKLVVILIALSNPQYSYPADLVPRL